VIGQPNLNFEVQRDQGRAPWNQRFQMCRMRFQTAVGGNALTQVLIGEQRYDLVLRLLAAIPRQRARLSRRFDW